MDEQLRVYNANVNEGDAIDYIVFNFHKQAYGTPDGMKYSTDDEYNNPIPYYGFVYDKGEYYQYDLVSMTSANTCSFIELKTHRI